MNEPERDIERFDLKVERMRRGLRQGDVARALGVSDSAISKFESGEDLPYDKTADDYRAALDELTQAVA